MTPIDYLDIHPEVAAALADNRPVVALESTIISHGMPFPQNVETAARVEAEVRAHGAIPATIAIIDGSRRGWRWNRSNTWARAVATWRRSAAATCRLSSRAAKPGPPPSPRP